VSILDVIFFSDKILHVIVSYNNKKDNDSLLKKKDNDSWHDNHHT